MASSNNEDIELEIKVPLVEKPVVEEPKKVEKIKFLCINLSEQTPVTQGFILFSGICFFFMACSFIEEYTFAVLPSFKYGWFMTFFELLFFGFFAISERGVRGEPLLAHRAPLSSHAYIAVFMTLSRGLTNVSLQFLNYPTQVIFKSLKLITVMIGSVVFFGRSYPFMEYVAAALLVLSAIFFSLGDATVSPAYDAFGLAIVSISLVFDSLHSNSQDYVLKQKNATNEETMLYSNWFACALTLLVIIFNGELGASIQYCSDYPVAYLLFTLRALAVYFGASCFLLAVKLFGIVKATTATTIRKVLSIIASFIVFPKPFAFLYLYGLGCFSIGVFINIKMIKK